MSSLVVMLPTAHRVTVKVTPNTSILQVLEEACRKAELNPIEWDLKHYNRIVELTNSVRFSGLPNNATLEMVQSKKIRKETTIKLGLQLESGKRLMEQFCPSKTLWEILEHWISSGENILPLKSAESAEEVLPVCIYMRHEIVGKENLETITLRSLGLTQGSAIIRLIHRSENQLRHQANVSAPLSRTTAKVEESVVAITNVLKEQKDSNSEEKQSGSMEWTDNGNSLSRNNSSTTCNAPKISKLDLPENADTNQAVDLSNPDPIVPDVLITGSGLEKTEAASMEVDQQPPTVLSNPTTSIINAQRYSKSGEIHVLGVRDAVIYHGDDIIIQRNDDCITDDFFTVTLADVDSIYRDLKSKRAELEDCPLTTAAQRSLEQDQAVLRMIREHPNTIVRIRFPNRYILQGTFRTLESIGAVYEFVRKLLTNADLDFHLFTAPPKKILLKESRLLEEGLIGLAVIYFSCSGSDDMVLKPEVYEKVSDPSAVFEKVKLAQKVSNSSVNQTEISATEEQIASTSSSSAPSSSSGQSTGTAARNIAPQTSNRNHSSVSGKVPKWFKK